jgi:hypothetical protein
VVGDLRLGEDLESSDGCRVGHQEVAGVPDGFRVPGRACVGCSDEVDEPDGGEQGEGAAVGQQVQVAADDDQVVGFADGLDEVGDPLGLRPSVGRVGLASPVA